VDKGRSKTRTLRQMTGAVSTWKTFRRIRFSREQRQKKKKEIKE